MSRSLKKMRPVAFGYPPPRAARRPTLIKPASPFRTVFAQASPSYFYGFDADKKAQKSLQLRYLNEQEIRFFENSTLAILPKPASKSLALKVSMAITGDIESPREVVVKIAAKHPDAMGAGLLLKEAAGLGLATPPGLSGFSGARPKPSPVVRLFSYLTPKQDVSTSTLMWMAILKAFKDASGARFDPATIERPTPPAAPAETATLNMFP